MRRAYNTGTVRVKDGEDVVLQEFEFEESGKSMEIEIDNTRLIRDPVKVEIEFEEAVIKEEEEE